MKNNTSDDKTQGEREDTRRAEHANYKPADPKRLAYLLDVAKLIAAPMDQESEALARIAAGQGAPVELFKVQQLEGGKFIAILGARLHSLRWRYGFDIRNIQERDGDAVRSWYYLKLNADGSPAMTPVPTATLAPRRAKKETKPQQAASAPAKNGWRAPGAGFVISPKHSPGIKPPTFPKPPATSQGDLFSGGPRPRWTGDPEIQRRGVR